MHDCKVILHDFYHIQNTPELPLGTCDHSLLSDQIQQIDTRLANLERDVHEIKQKVLDTSLEKTVNLAMQDLQDKVYALNTLIESHKVGVDDDDCKVNFMQ